MRTDWTCRTEKMMQSSRLGPIKRRTPNTMMVYRPNILLLCMCIRGWTWNKLMTTQRVPALFSSLLLLMQPTWLAVCPSPSSPSGPDIHSFTHQPIHSSESETMLHFTQLLQLNSDPESNKAVATAASLAAPTAPFLTWCDMGIFYCISIRSFAPQDPETSLGCICVMGGVNNRN